VFGTYYSVSNIYLTNKRYSERKQKYKNIHKKSKRKEPKVTKLMKLFFQKIFYISSLHCRKKYPDYRTIIDS